MLYGMDDMITLEHLTKIYGQGDEEDLCVLEDVSLSIKRGKFTVLLGPSGSGKSTLLNLIAMLDKPTSGKIFVDGEEITALKSETVRPCAFKKWGLFSSLTAFFLNFHF